jgi:DNA-binding LytR/AlgR family response regulator
MGNAIPIIFVTVDAHRAADGYLVEAMGFLPKPIDENRLALFWTESSSGKEGKEL